jgi:hypothetical protein
MYVKVNTFSGRQITMFRCSTPKGVFMSDFYEDLEAINVHQIASESLQNVFPIEFKNNFFSKFSVFSIFLKVFLSEFIKKMLFVKI